MKKQLTTKTCSIVDLFNEIIFLLHTSWVKKIKNRNTIPLFNIRIIFPLLTKNPQPPPPSPAITTPSLVYTLYGGGMHDVDLDMGDVHVTFVVLRPGLVRHGGAQTI